MNKRDPRHLNFWQSIPHDYQAELSTAKFFLVCLVILGTIAFFTIPQIEKMNEKEHRRIEKETGHKYYRGADGKLKHSPSCPETHTFPVVD